MQLSSSASARELGFLVPPSNATEGQIWLSPRGKFLLPPLRDWKIPLPLPSSGTHAGVTSSRRQSYRMEKRSARGCRLARRPLSRVRAVPCQHGDFKMCINCKVTGIDFDGGYAEYVIAPAPALAALRLVGFEDEGRRRGRERMLISV
jgi:Alcohol dehydrogenase GroES-like domain